MKYVFGILFVLLLIAVVQLASENAALKRKLDAIESKEGRP